MGSLSVLAVDGAKAKQKAYKLYDGEGLYLLVTPSGAKLWRYKFRREGKEQLFALGRYSPAKRAETQEQAAARRAGGVFTLAEARIARDEARALVKQGLDPKTRRDDTRRENLENQRARAQEEKGAFAKVVAAWLERGKSRKGKAWAPGTKRAKKARADSFLLPKLGTLHVAKIGSDEIRAVLKAANAGAWSALHVKGDLSGIFDYAVREGLASTNPLPGLRALVDKPKSENKANLEPAQIRAFYANLKGYRGYPETAYCLKLIALTACRPGEAANAEWSEFDLDARLWRRPGSKMKAGEDHVFPLSDRAIALLEELLPITGNGRYLFPHRTKDTHADPARLRYAMRDLKLGKGASPHCWRTTFSTWANENGFRPDAIEKQLAHGEPNQTRAAYNKAMLLEERRTMMRAWADYLKAAESENVVPLRAA